MNEPPQENQDKKGLRGGATRGMARITEIGVTMAACVLIGVFSGKYLDRWLGTSPWLLLLFSLLGAAAAFRAIFLMAKKGEK